MKKQGTDNQEYELILFFPLPGKKIVKFSEKSLKMALINANFPSRPTTNIKEIIVIILKTIWYINNL